MQEKQKTIIVKCIGLLTLVTGLYAIRPVWQPHTHVWLHLSSNAFFWFHLPELFHRSGVYVGILVILFEIVLIAKFAVAYGLFRVRPWARSIAIAVLTADFVFRAAGAVTMLLITAFISPMPPPSATEDSVTMVVPMWPSYVIAIISIASVLVLIQKPLREHFKPARESA